MKAGSVGSVEVGYHTGAAGARFAITDAGGVCEGHTTFAVATPLFTLTAPSNRSVTVHSEILGIVSDPGAAILLIGAVSALDLYASGGVAAPLECTTPSFPAGLSSFRYNASGTPLVGAAVAANYIFSGLLPNSVGISLSLSLLDCAYVPPGGSFAMWAWSAAAPTFTFTITVFEET